MKVGNLVIWDDEEIGIIEHIFDNGDVSVVFSDGAHQVDCDDLEVIND